MFKNRKKGFSLVELIVVIAILVVFAAVLIPSLLQYTENSRAQKDESAMDEVVNAVQLAMADQDCYDEMLQYSCTNNYITYTDSSGVYGQVIADGEFWAPDGSGRATTITFNPEVGPNGDTIYNLDTALVNDMTYGNGSNGENRVMEGSLIENNQCYLKNASLNGEQTGYLYNMVRQSIGNNVITTSQTYRNSSFTIFIKFSQKDGTTVADVDGSFNGTNLYEGAAASKGSGTSSYDNNGDAITTVTTPGTTESNYTTSDLQGGGTFTPEYKNSEHITNRPVKIEHGGIIPEGGTYYVGVTSKITGDYTGATAIYTAGQPFPSIKTGDVYVYGDYEYRYNLHIESTMNLRWVSLRNGWGLRVRDNTKQIYGIILESINDKNVTSISGTFRGCTNLAQAPDIPNSVTVMSSTFYGCTNLTQAPAIPNSVTDMGYTFYNCTKLTQAPDIPNSVTNMMRTFSGCKNLAQAPVIPNSVTNMAYTFWQCHSLTQAPVIPNSVTNMQETFRECITLTKAPIIPNSVTNMRGTFYGCTNLTQAPVIPNSVTSIRDTFAGCTKLTQAPVIPNSVTNMQNAFSSCTSLTGTITIHANPTEWTTCLRYTKITSIVGDTTMAEDIMLTKTSTATNPTT